MKKIFSIVVIIYLSLGVYASIAVPAKVADMLWKGKQAIETGQYEEAVNSLGDILTALGNQTKSPEIISFGATVQAYGIISMGNDQLIPTAKHYLNVAIENDPNWEYPQVLLKTIKAKESDK
ncbi:MAG: hypothetical protein PHQ52_07430 [Candidatus Omnitrophica bacterium]|nr:hypothetical protein [Candidatus Omnitrophota bacterium]